MGYSFAAFSRLYTHTPYTLMVYRLWARRLKAKGTRMIFEAMDKQESRRLGEPPPST
jgi:hypothetical protein